MLGEVGSSLADLAMLTAEDVEALNLKVTLPASRRVCCVPSDLSVRFWQTLTRRRLRGNLCSLPNSQCSAVPSAALEGCASRPPAPLFHARDVESVVLKISRNTLKDDSDHVLVPDREQLKMALAQQLSGYREP